MTRWFKSTPQKNILLLGDKSCGKRSFILRYKDGIASSEEALPELKTVIYKKKLNANDYIDLNFTLDRTNDTMQPSGSVQTKFDLILILVDLSSEQAKERLKFYTEQAQTHFPAVATMTVGTKSDKQLKTNAFFNTIPTSAKTGVGFDQFDAELCAFINPQAGKTGSCTVM